MVVVVVVVTVVVVFVAIVVLIGSKAMNGNSTGNSNAGFSL